MTEMILAEPALADRIVGRLADAGPTSAASELADAVTQVGGRGEPILVTGCGTSEHAAQAVAAILAEGLAATIADGSSSPRSAQAFELSLEAPTRGLVIAISHEGGTAMTLAALAGARAGGARTATITASRRSPAGAAADIVVETAELDQSWCHTVGYLSPIVAATAVAARIRDQPVDGALGRALRTLLAAGLDQTATIEAIAAVLAGLDRVLVIASGADRPAGRELVLKIEEGTWIPAAYRDLETLLHGHLAATDGSTGVVLILTDRDHSAERASRARGVLAAARIIGMPVAAILSEAIAGTIAPDLTPAGRIVVPDAPDLPRFVAASLCTATALQTLTERLARARGVDPDAIHRDVDRYREAAKAAES
ncbi:MAG: SIS domain-containing protein [Chloroflexi bacterium]|nr:SIS domain-containing protein [Chloroflexota bacterium]